MERRRLWPLVRKVWITLGLSLTVIFVGWSLIAYRASEPARAALAPDALVDVRQDDGSWSFIPRRRSSEPSTALVFFPGALVDPVAYAPLARAVAAAGFPAYVVELPRRGAFGGAEDPELWARLRSLLGPLGVGGGRESLAVRLVRVPARRSVGGDRGAGAARAHDPSCPGRALRGRGPRRGGSARPALTPRRGKKEPGKEGRKLWRWGGDNLFVSR